jgi:hypothetical protein
MNPVCVGFGAAEIVLTPLLLSDEAVFGGAGKKV